jgi:hypothetical protein
MMLTATRNINFQRSIASDVIEQPAPTNRAQTAAARFSPAAELRYRKVPRSPDEEFAHRIQKLGKLRLFSQAVIALILQKQTFAEVTPSGVNLTYQKTKYKFWHENSLTCANRRGEKVLATFDPDDMSFVHILTEEGVYVESIPQKNKIAWFDADAMKTELQKKQRSLNRDMKHFQEIHKATSETKINRILTNAEKLQIVNPIPAPTKDTHFDADEPEAAFPMADRISMATDAIRGQRTEHEAQRTRIKTTTARAANLLDPEDKFTEEDFEEPATARRFTAANLL